jgi:ATP-dependent helicase/nuclease subunit A
MVDEYQDTNAVQNAIFDALTDDGKTLFQVGDIKQSIYRFRLADPTIFLKKYHTFVDGGKAKEGQPRRLVLSRNFRSRPAVLEGVNFLFENLMTAELGEIDYTDDQRLNPGLMGLPPREDGDTELNVVDLSTLEQEADKAKIPKDKVEAYFVAKRVRELLDKPFMVTEGENFRPIRPEDIAILYRSPGAVLDYLTVALDEQNIPWQNDSYENYFAATEVCVARAFLEVIDNPRQDVPLISVLRSPVYGFTPDDLAMLRAKSPKTDFYTCVERGAEEGNPLCVRFLGDLKSLRVQMVDSSCAQVLWYLYDQMGLLSLFGAMSGGQRRQENLLAFYNYARSFEGQGHRGVFAFVSQLRRLLEQEDAPAIAASRGGSGVQIMSIHKSKGLEFPVVVLAGLNRMFNKKDEQRPMLFHSKLGVGPRLLDTDLRMEYPTLARTAVQLKLNKEMKAEELRLLYVAMTRAREKLIMVMSFADAEKELLRLLPDAGPHPEPEALAQLDSLGKWILLPVLGRRDAEGLRFGESPSDYTPASDHWQIHLVHSASDYFRPQEQPEEEQAEELPQPTEDSNLVQQLLWQYPWKELADMPSKVTATQMKGRQLDEEAAEEAPKQPRPLEFRRPSFEQKGRVLTPAQRGSAIHALMERIDLKRADTVEGVKEEIARLVQGGWLMPEQGKVIDPKQVAKFWSSELGKEAAASQTLRREFKFSILAQAEKFYAQAPEGEKVLLQGVVDCCFETEEGFTVIDFKSDYVPYGQEQHHAEQYRGQIEVYARALEEIFGKKVQRCVVWFFSKGIGVEIC